MPAMARMLALRRAALTPKRLLVGGLAVGGVVTGGLLGGQPARAEPLSEQTGAPRVPSTVHICVCPARPPSRAPRNPNLCVFRPQPCSWRAGSEWLATCWVCGGRGRPTRRRTP